MNNLEKYKIFISKKVEKFLGNLHPKIVNKFNQQIERRLRDKPNIPDNIHIKHILYDLFELKIDNIKFYYFVFYRNVKIVEYYADGEFNPFIEIMLSSTKDRQEDTIKHLRKNYDTFYNKSITKDKYKLI